jgi:2,4-dienoyl-CoA reductase-like NADH-dependent reductase (Old Yellow Enzyme family)
MEIDGQLDFPEQFLLSNSNQRSDFYDGSVQKRVRFVLEVTEAIVKAVGANRVELGYESARARTKVNAFVDGHAHLSQSHLSLFRCFGSSFSVMYVMGFFTFIKFPGMRMPA